MERFNYVFEFDADPVEEHGNEVYFPTIYDFVKDAVESIFGYRGEVRLVASRIHRIMGERHWFYQYYFLIPEMNTQQKSALSRWCNENRQMLRVVLDPGTRIHDPGFIAGPDNFMWTVLASHEVGNYML